MLYFYCGVRGIDVLISFYIVDMCIFFIFLISNVIKFDLNFYFFVDQCSDSSCFLKVSVKFKDKSFLELLRLILLVLYNLVEILIKVKVLVKVGFFLEEIVLYIIFFFVLLMLLIIFFLCEVVKKCYVRFIFFFSI